MDAVLEKRQVKRAYKICAPAYDFVFDWIFHPAREQAIGLLDIKGGEQILEVGIGTGLNLPLYPTNCRITGIDLSEEMLEKAQDRVVELGLNNITLKSMDATVMDFGDSDFDAAVAHLEASGVEVLLYEDEGHRSFTGRHLYFHDPDGTTWLVQEVRRPKARI